MTLKRSSLSAIYLLLQASPGVTAPNQSQPPRVPLHLAVMPYLSIVTILVVVYTAVYLTSPHLSEAAILGTWATLFTATYKLVNRILDKTPSAPTSPSAPPAESAEPAKRKRSKSTKKARTRRQTSVKKDRQFDSE